LPEMHSVEYLLNQKLIDEKLDTNNFNITNVSKTFTQILTHQKIEAVFLSIAVEKPLTEKFELVKRENLAKFAFSKILNLYFQI